MEMEIKIMIFDKHTYVYKTDFKQIFENMH